MDLRAVTGDRGVAVSLALVLCACSAPAPSPPAGDAAGQGAVTAGGGFETHVAAGGTAPVPDILRNPYAGQEKSATEGEKLFSSMNCDGCHGGGAVGFVGPSLSDGRWRYGGSDGAIFQSISLGRPKGMPAFSGLLAPEIIWKLVTYLRSLPVPKAVPTQAW